MKAYSEITPLVIDDGLVRLDDQAQILMKDIGTAREWCAIGLEDEEGFAAVVALAHPVNAKLIIHAVNLLPGLVEALEKIAHHLDSPKGLMAAYDMIDIASAAIKKANTINIKEGN